MEEKCNRWSFFFPQGKSHRTISASYVIVWWYVCMWGKCLLKYLLWFLFMLFTMLSCWDRNGNCVASVLIYSLLLLSEWVNLNQNEWLCNERNYTWCLTEDFNLLVSLLPWPVFCVIPDIQFTCTVMGKFKLW